MPVTLNPELRRALAERIRYYNELGIYDFYRREIASSQSAAQESDSFLQPELREEMSPRRTSVAVSTVLEENPLEVVTNKPEYGVNDPVKALKIIREDLGDCTR